MLGNCRACDGTGNVIVTKTAQPAHPGMEPTQYETEVACRECGGTGRNRPSPDTADAVKALRKKVRRARTTDPFSDGDVIRWTRTLSGRGYTYAALRAGGRWWVTGVSRYGNPGPRTYEELTKLLTHPETQDIAVSATWQSV